MINKHLFALYTTAQLPTQNNIAYQLKDADLHSRVTKILRLREKEKFILFNGSTHLTITLSNETFSSKNTIHGHVNEIGISTPLKPTISLLQGIPKKAVFEEIIYNAAQLGVSDIIPIKTAKSHNFEFSIKEMTRFNNIMIAACEQAKQFVIPQLAAPISLSESLKNITMSSLNIVFDSTGVSCETLLSQMIASDQISVLFGPEGGLTDQELMMVNQENFIKSRLTQTILRSEDAPLLGIGLLRSLIF